MAIKFNQILSIDNGYLIIHDNQSDEKRLALPGFPLNTSGNDGVID